MAEHKLRFDASSGSNVLVLDISRKEFLSYVLEVDFEEGWVVQPVCNPDGTMQVDHENGCVVSCKIPVNIVGVFLCMDCGRPTGVVGNSEQYEQCSICKHKLRLRRRVKQ